ncbi:hypothetical protein CEXT_505841 [Caerostris extrusa]|uniref:Uncharacterized protein n=1 Tax=Caerostris extrusa TaxID=172846 RepID=A0AAV4MF97_CAEEX|nr:hypothetical protein CEXT_505841 [Caerostris extrusa]
MLHAVNRKQCPFCAKESSNFQLTLPLLIYLREASNHSESAFRMYKHPPALITTCIVPSTPRHANSRNHRKLKIEIAGIWGEKILPPAMDPHITKDWQTFTKPGDVIMYVNEPGPPGGRRVTLSVLMSR